MESKLNRRIEIFRERMHEKFKEGLDFTKGELYNLSRELDFFIVKYMKGNKRQ